MRWYAIPKDAAGRWKHTRIGEGVHSGISLGDLDADGDLDLALTGVQKDAMHWLLRNTLTSASTASTSRAFFVRVVDEAGRSTLPGAEVALFINGSRVLLGTRLVDAGSGYNSQNDLPLHFAVPVVDRVFASVRIKRPGREAVLTSAAISLNEWRNRVHEIRVPEGAGSPK